MKEGSNEVSCWQGDSLCPSTSPQCPALPCGQRCLYQHTGGHTDPLSLTGSHTTPVARYVDDLSFQLQPTSSGGCSVKAKSSSQLWQVSCANINILGQARSYESLV